MEREKNFLKPRQGFSLTELMIVVGIVALLSLMVTIKFTAFQIRTRRTEAKLNLTAIQKLQEIYLSENGKFYPTNLAFTFLTTRGALSTPTSCAIANPLGFSVPNCKVLRYSYYTEITGTGFTARAFEEIYNGKHLVFSRCATADKIDVASINEAKNFGFLEDDAPSFTCPTITTPMVFD